MNFFDIPLELSAQHRKALLDFERKNASLYYDHTKEHDHFYLNLLLEEKVATPQCVQDVLSMFSYPPVTWSFVKIGKKVRLPVHLDGPRGRKTVVVFPLQPYNENYASCDIMRFPNSKRPLQEITFRPCYAFSTERWHRVKNNKYCRKSLQLWYDDTIEDLYTRFIKKGLLL